jgi:hypothetical protein
MLSSRVMEQLLQNNALNNHPIIDGRFFIFTMPLFRVSSYPFTLLLFLLK